MVESVGRKLQEARLARQLEIEDVAETTKIRPERIIDLEADEYGHFPNSTYAKSFLEKFQVERTISLAAYQYLTGPPVPKHLLEPRKIAPRGFRVPPVVVAILLLVILVGVPLFSYLALNVPRVVGTKLADEKMIDSERQIGDSSSRARMGSQSPILPPAVTGTFTDASPAAVSQSPREDGESKDVSTSASSTAQGRMEDGVEVRRALPVGSPASDGQAGIMETTFPDKKLEVRILKRTYVKVTKDQESAQPVFEGFAGPDSRPIVVAGKRFWVHVLDKGAVEVRKDGQVVPSDSGDIVIN
jgi:cytoskeletal protein RodZ